MNKQLSPKAAALTLVTLLVVLGGGFWYWWNFMGRIEGKSLGEVMKYYDQPKYKNRPNKPMTKPPMMGAPAAAGKTDAKAALNATKADARTEAKAVPAGDMAEKTANP